MKEKVGEEVYTKNGGMTCYKRWYKGELGGGQWVDGWTGRETILYENKLVPAHTFTVKEKNGKVS